MDIKVGEHYNLFYSKGNVNNRKIHIRGIVDDRIIYRCWYKSTADWVYYVVEKYWFDCRKNSLTKVK